jgi:lipid-A-disaccharide synthase
MQPVDILLLSNGPGEVSTWVRPVVHALRQQLGEDRNQVRISVVLIPCNHAVGTEAAIARSYPQVDRVQGSENFISFLLWGKTAENWDWREKGVVLFLGGDQFFPLVLGKRLGYRTVIYAEWDARWSAWIDHFGVMNTKVIDKLPPKYHHKCTIVGDLMEDIRTQSSPRSLSDPNVTPLIALLPGSKPWKLDQGVPLCLAIAEQIHQQKPKTKFIIPVAPTLTLETLAKFAHRSFSPIIEQTGWTGAQLMIDEEEKPYLKTDQGLKVQLLTEFPAYNMLAQCHLAFTTVGANTAELATLGVPMVVLLPTQRLDAMRTWDGLPGMLANLPFVGAVIAKIINLIVIQYKHLYAWPNIWAKEEIVPELLGELKPSEVAKIAIDWLDHPEKLAEIRKRLSLVRGEPGAAAKIAEVVKKQLI